MDGVRLDPLNEIARLAPEQRRLAEIEAAWRWRENRAWPNRDDRTPENRDRLAEAQNWRCCYCGVCMAAPDGRRATFEHVLPRSLGGSDLIGNLAISCHDCNNKRGAQMRAEHIEALAVLDAAWGPG